MAGDRTTETIEALRSCRALHRTTVIVSGALVLFTVTRAGPPVYSRGLSALRTLEDSIPATTALNDERLTLVPHVMYGERGKAAAQLVYDASVVVSADTIAFPISGTIETILHVIKSYKKSDSLHVAIMVPDSSDFASLLSRLFNEEKKEFKDRLKIQLHSGAVNQIEYDTELAQADEAFTWNTVFSTRKGKYGLELQRGEETRGCSADTIEAMISADDLGLAAVRVDYLEGLLDDIGSAPLDQARSRLTRRMREESESVETAGLKLGANIVGWAGPVILTSLLLLLLAHLRNAFRLIRAEHNPIEFPWIAMFTDRVSVLLTFASFVALPTVAVVVSLYKIDLLVGLPAVLGSAATLVVCLSNMSIARRL